MRIDAHQHFWRISDGIYNWIDDGLWTIQRDFQPEHLGAYLAHFDIDKTILVQAAEEIVENQFMLEIAAAYNFVGGVVAWLDLAQEQHEQIVELSKHTVVKGVRPVLQGITDNSWVLQPTVQANLKVIQQHGLHFEALIQPRHLSVINQLAHEHPDLQIVVNHAAKPVFNAAGEVEGDWFDRMSLLAERQNVHCKFSGLATEFGPGWSSQSLSGVFHHLAQSFGPNRLMWGSDWPVLEDSGSYGQWFGVCNELCSLHHARHKDLFFGEVAALFYRIE